MSALLKKNVNEFNADIDSNGGYKYTTRPSYSAHVANLRLTQATIEAIEKLQPKKVMDIGCGDGVYTRDLKARFPHLEFWGLDAAETAVKAASKAFPDIKFLVGNVLDPRSLPTQKFDLAVIRGVLHHTSDPFLCIRNMAPLADRILIIEPNGYNPVLKLIEKTSKYHREHEERSFTYNQLKRWCQGSGFEVVSCNYVGFVPFFFPTTLAKMIYFFQPLLEKIPVVRHLFSACYVIECRKK